MGQRFQIIENTEGNIKIFHVQWLWGDYAIRRIGTAVRNYLRYGKGYRQFQEFLKGSFYGKPNDMNNFSRYFSDEDSYNDNKEICTYYIKDKKIIGKKKSFKKLLKELDNNDGYFYIEFDSRGNIKGYCFILGGWREEEKKNNYKPITAKEYMGSYEIQEGFNKKQKKEYEDGLKTFEKLSLIEPIKVIKYKEYLQ